MEMISWTDCVRNEYPIYNKKRKANWLGHRLRRNCLLKHVIEEKTQGKNDGRWRKKT